MHGQLGLESRIAGRTAQKSTALKYHEPPLVPGSDSICTFRALGHNERAAGYKPGLQTNAENGQLNPGFTPDKSNIKQITY